MRTSQLAPPPSPPTAAQQQQHCFWRQIRIIAKDISNHAALGTALTGQVNQVCDVMIQMVEKGLLQSAHTI